MFGFCSLFSSSKGNCGLIRTEKTQLLIDAGMAVCHIERKLEEIGTNPEEINGILITHEHGDHVRGAGAMSRRYDIPIYAAPKLWQEFSGFGHIKSKNQVIYEYGMQIGDLELDFFKTQHDAMQPLGLLFYYKGKKLGFCTDTGCITQGMVKALDGADALVFEANHDPKMLKEGVYPAYLKARIGGKNGHLSNHDSGTALTKIINDSTRHVLLAHLSEENNRPDLALKTVASILAEAGVKDEITVEIAPAYQTSNWINLE